MAENADVLIQVGALPDVASAKEAGRKIREIIEAEVSKFAGSTLKGQKGAKGVIGAISGLSGTTGVDTYYKAAESRYALRNVSRKGLTPAQRAELREMDRELGIIENVARRSSINEPINRTFAETRLRSKIDASLQTLNKGLTPNFAEVYRATEKSGDTKKLAALDRQIAIKTKAAGVVLSNPEDVTNEQFGAATATKNIVKELKNNTKALGGLTKVAVAAAGAFAVAATNTYAANLQTEWDENISRSTFGHMAAAAQRKKNTGKLVGGTGGAAVGAAIGAAAAGAVSYGALSGVGATIGAGIGGSVGSTLGELPGIEDEKRLESVKKSIAQVQQRYKAAALYRGRYSVGFGEAVETTGMASASDVQNMVHNSQTLSARMMFGQVGDDEMLMYSLMPEYFAAAMNGASDAELAAAFKSSVEKLPPNLRLWAAERVGGGSAGMLAYTQTPVYEGTQAAAAEYRELDAAQMIAGKGFLHGSVQRALQTGYAQFNKFRDDIQYLTEDNPNGTYGLFSVTPGSKDSAVLSELLFGKTFNNYSSIDDIENEYRDIMHKKEDARERGMGAARAAAKQTIYIVLPNGEQKKYENEILEEMGNSVRYLVGSD